MEATFKERLTGVNRCPACRWSVVGTDLGIPYVLENGSIGYLFGDTFSSPLPGQGSTDWRSPVMLRSNVHPGAPGGVIFDSAAKVAGDGFAPEIMANAHDTCGNSEFTVIPNDGISFPETGGQLVSVMSVRKWLDGQTPGWRTNYAGLAYSDNGNDFERTSLQWLNNDDDSDPFQMWTMQRDGEFVYIFSVRAGRQDGPMMLRRVRWDRMLSPEEYEDWGWKCDTGWRWGQPCTPILSGKFGEPSVRRLSDGIWAMSYLNLSILAIVTRTATRPDGIWTDEKIQVTWAQEPFLYGGFIHPWSTRAEGDLHLMVSKWEPSTAYHMSQWVGTL